MIYGAMLFLKFTCVYCLSMLFSYVYLFIKDVDYSYCNPSTGPVYFNDVKPGDHGGNMDTTMIKEGLLYSFLYSQKAASWQSAISMPQW